MEVARPKKKTKAKKKTRKVTEEKASERGLEQDTPDTIETNDSESTGTHHVLPPSSPSLLSPPDLPTLPVIDIFDESTPPVVQEPAIQEPVVQEPVVATATTNEGDDDLIQFDVAPNQTQQNLENLPEEHCKDSVDVLPDAIQLTNELTIETASDGVRVDNVPLLVDITPEAPPPTTTSDVLSNEGATTVENESNIEANTEIHVDTGAHVHVQNVNTTTVAVEEVLEEPAVFAPPSEETVLPTAPPTLMYPTLDSLIAASSVTESVLIPYSEEDLSLLYPNPQLGANTEFIDNFIKESQQDSHPLYELLKQYLKARLSSKAAEGKLQNLKKDYSKNNDMIWTITDKRISSNGRCADGKSISHSHSHKFAQLDADAVFRTEDNLKSIKTALQEEYTMLSYSAQLAYIHVEFYIHQLINSMPELADMPQTAPITGYIPYVPPGSMDDYTYELRSCISVLFIFERRPSRDQQFTSSCRNWLNTLIAALLRVASLPDHQFVLNHILRCPPGVGQWAIGYIQPLSPLQYKGVVRQNNNNHDRNGVSMEWKLSSQDYTWDGPIIDHWITMLSTLFQPIMYVNNKMESLLLITCQYAISHISSYQMLQFISFCTCLIRLFGRIFSILRHSSYKEFIKQVGRTIRQTVQYVADHWSSYKALKLSAGDTMSCMPSGEDPVLRYSLERLQIEFDQFVLRATQWILTAHKLGAWQFMADMPYGSISGLTLWKILWTLYHYQVASHRDTGNDGRERRGSVLMDRTDLDLIPENVPDIIQSIRGSLCHAKFVDILMKTFTSEVIFLLTTFVNMARSRDGEKEEEKEFINFVAQEIFQLTQVEEYARDAYSRSGHTLLDSVARVHPFIMSVLLEETRKHVDEAGENCILLFKELPLQLWLPSVHDITLVREWLVSSTLTSPQHLIAKVIISGLNWGVKEEEPAGSTSLVLPPSIHRGVALSIIDLWYHQFTDDSTSPGANANKTLYSSTINRISKLIQIQFGFFVNF
ncbi:PREDICTED: ectopic P granules protein 5 homolog [Amphimedon queenslandica]|uniref:Uncharacterized protein n=1 Tax=Amphimedon queenslandica TaxID=400682 RepID=A0AAN0JHK8_AMPQE|nr:PREDICTED: ectopic P granules protein 5 homolog [Amphimedon queenslandica]|eukprot:XP_019856281.1 PREDICTED: ectopic P granules protein 5 homolog [Amphimedon queenslandica]